MGLWLSAILKARTQGTVVPAFWASVLVTDPGVPGTCGGGGGFGRPKIGAWSPSMAKAPDPPPSAPPSPGENDDAAPNASAAVVPGAAGGAASAPGAVEGSTGAGSPGNVG